jgi:hypothetical protein
VRERAVCGAKTQRPARGEGPRPSGALSQALAHATSRRIPARRTAMFGHDRWSKIEHRKQAQGAAASN